MLLLLLPRLLLLLLTSVLASVLAAAMLASVLPVLLSAAMLAAARLLAPLAAATLAVARRDLVRQAARDEAPPCVFQMVRLAYLGARRRMLEGHAVPLADVMAQACAAPAVLRGALGFEMRVLGRARVGRLRRGALDAHVGTATFISWVAKRRIAEAPHAPQIAIVAITATSLPQCETV